MPKEFSTFECKEEKIMKKNEGNTQQLWDNFKRCILYIILVAIGEERMDQNKYSKLKWLIISLINDRHQITDLEGSKNTNSVKYLINIKLIKTKTKMSFLQFLLHSAAA